MAESPGPLRERLFTIARVLYFLLLLYLFFSSIELMGTAFRMGGRGFAEQLINTAMDPVKGLLIGFLATSMIQSSSTTTTIVVGLVASGTLSIQLAVPIVMGANIGTTTTNTLVSMGHVARSAEFAPAFSAATVHDFFNVLAALTILPIEIVFHPVEKTAVFAQSVFAGAGGMSLASPLRAIVSPAANTVAGLIPYQLPLLVFSLGLLFFALHQMMKVMRGAVLERLETLFNTVLFRNDAASFGLGMVATATVQSSSATTSLVVPLAGTGVLTLRQVFPYTLGANVGTTITAILASFSTGNAAAVTVALAHLTFNVFGIAIYYPLRALPIWLAMKAGRFAASSRASTVKVVAIYAMLHLIPLAYIIFT
jgi:sodium-dependent phosphate cotransporter